MFECLVQVENGVLGTVEIANIICKQLLMSQRFELLHPTADREREREREVGGWVLGQMIHVCRNDLTKEQNEGLNV